LNFAVILSVAKDVSYDFLAHQARS
jgi:hypothetical protein